MSDYSEIENGLIGKVKDKTLRESLNQIRASVEAIWSVEAPRVIQGFTDHGFNHCLRLLGYASQLLDSNKGSLLIDEEQYLLIAGIYLHDIGMQCDVTKFPQIKDTAIGFGANFNLVFTSKNANQYTLKEQIEIRKNHHLLTAAWIDYAFNEPKTTLGKAIQSVPDYLLSDLIDICKYHSKLKIQECPIQFEINPKGRKQLIATLVRFSDELDVAKSRVSIDTVMNFSMDSENAYYWWLHHLTIIDITNNILTIKVRLNTEDYKLYSSFVKETYIDTFRIKNKPVLAILNNNGFHLSINSESEVISNNYTPKLPVEITSVIQKMQSTVLVEENSPVSESKTTLNIKQKYFPKPKPYFVGRMEELKNLQETFNSNSFIFIEGSGGIGKTQVIAKFIENLGMDDRIVWYECIPTSQPDDIILGAGFDELLKGKDKSEREKFSAFKDKIEEHNLVIFLDNYQEVENIPAFKSFLSFNNDYLRKGHLIVLCRDNIITPNLHPKRIPIKGLGNDSLEHAKKLIEHSYPNLSNTPIADLENICRTLKGYPLAIDLAIYLLSLNVSVDNILNVAVSEAQTEGSEIEKISSRLLNEIFTRPDASEHERSFLKLLSIFRGKVLKSDAIFVIPTEIFEAASRKLISRNLLEINNDYLELHPLIREFCYNELENKEEIHQKAANYYISHRVSKLNPELEEKIFYHLSCSKQWIEVSNTILNLGREFISQGYIDRLQQMILHIKQQDIFDPILDIYEGDIAQIKGDWDLALTLFYKAKLSAIEEVSIEGVIKYGEILFRKGDVEKSRPYFEIAIKNTEKTKNKKSHARALNDLGLVEDYFGNLKDALIILNEAYQIRLEINESEDIAASLSNIGTVKDKLGLKNEALKLYEKGLIISEEIGDKVLISLCLHNMGVSKKNLGLNAEALILVERSLKYSKEIGNKSVIACNLRQIGSIKMKLGQKNEGLELFEKSLIISEEIGDKDGIATSLSNIGVSKNELGLYVKAMDVLNKSLKINKEIGNKLSIATCLNNIAGVKRNQGLRSEAIAFQEESLRIAEEIGDKFMISNSLNNMGGYLLKLGLEINKACLYLFKSIALKRQMGMPVHPNTVNFIIELRKKVGIVQFKEIARDSFKQLDVELQSFIKMDEFLSEPIKVEKKLGRNEPCYCGSGKKYKNCHGAH